MVKRGLGAVAAAGGALHSSAGGGPAGADVEEHFVVARIADETFGFRLSDIAEIIRVPRLAFMPLGPPSLLGLANLRGLVFPVISLRRLLGFADAPLQEAARVAIVDRGPPVGFVVDRIETLLMVPAGRIETSGAGAGRLAPELLHCAVRRDEGESSIKILNSERVIRDQFSHLGISGRRATVHRTSAAEPTTLRSEAQLQVTQVELLSFDLGSQEYALPLDRVREIVALPEHISAVAGAETAVLGVVTLRDRLLPLVSLRALLGLPAADDARNGKVIVLSLGRGTVGMVADRTREILRLDPALIDPAPSLLTRGAGDADIESICRLEGGKRLVAVLSPDRLFRSNLVARVLAETGSDGSGQSGEAAGRAMADELFILFRLGDQEYGLPVAAVKEVARPPDKMTRLPKAPPFIEGVINLRGSVVPIVDLRRRFAVISEEPATGRRILVLAVGGGLTGFLVDGVSEVLKIPLDAIRPAPQLSPEQMRLIGRVANLESQGRIILLVEPDQLFDQIEGEMLASFDRTLAAQHPRAS